MHAIDHEAKILVQATPEDVWDALTNPEKTRGYYLRHGHPVRLARRVAVDE